MHISKLLRIASLAALTAASLNSLQAHPASAAAPLGYSIRTVAPCRLIDTRITRTPIPAGGSISVPVTGKCGILKGAVGAVLSLTATGPVTNTWVTIRPTGIGGTSTLNLAAGSTRSAQAFTTLNPVDGTVTISSLATTDVVVAVSAAFVADTAATAARRIVTTAATRILDTRSTAKPQAGSTTRVSQF